MSKELKNYYNELDEYFEKFWGKKIMEIKWMKGPYLSLPENFHISIYQIDKSTNVMVTSRLSLCDTNEKIEICMYYKSGAYSETRLAEILTITAYFHCTQENLSLRHTFNFGESIIQKSCLKRGYLSWPYLESKYIESFQYIKVIYKENLYANS